MASYHSFQNPLETRKYADTVSMQKKKKRIVK